MSKSHETKVIGNHGWRLLFLSILGIKTTFERKKNMHTYYFYNLQKGLWKKVGHKKNIVKNPY